MSKEYDTKYVYEFNKHTGRSSSMSMGTTRADSLPEAAIKSLDFVTRCFSNYTVQRIDIKLKRYAGFLHG